MNTESAKYSNDEPICSIGNGQGEELYLSLNSLLKCLHLAEMNATIPSLPESWKEQNIPKYWQVIFNGPHDSPPGSDLVFSIKSQTHIYKVKQKVIIECLFLLQEHEELAPLPHDWWEKIEDKYPGTIARRFERKYHAHNKNRRDR